MDETHLPSREQPRVRAILEAIPDDLMLVSVDGTIREYKTGRSKQHLPMDLFLGTNLSELISESQMQKMILAIQEVLQGRPSEALEFELQGRDYEARVAPMDGDTVLILFRDVTEQKELQRLKDEFIAAVSHELNTPLTSIMGFTELLINQLYSPEEFPEFLDNIQYSTLRLKDMVGNLLDSSRLEAGRFEVHLQPTHLQDTLEQVAKSFLGVAKLAQIEFRVEIEPLPVIEADANRIAQVAGNLLSNALKFCPKGGTIWLRAREGASAPQRPPSEHGGVEFEVEDTGPGIPLGEHGQLFTRYGRTRSATQRGITGTGLGLYISKAIVEAHQGRIWLEPESGGGARFCVWLPK